MPDQNTGIPTRGPWNGAIGKDPNPHVKHTWVQSGEEML